MTKMHLVLCALVHLSGLEVISDITALMHLLSILLTKAISCLPKHITPWMNMQNEKYQLKEKSKTSRRASKTHNKKQHF